MTLFLEAGVGFMLASPVSRLLVHVLPESILFPASMLLPFFLRPSFF